MSAALNIPLPAAAEFVTTRTFDAPRERVWRAWTERDRLARWWGPKGCTLHVERFEPRPGGVFHYRMTPPGCGDMWGRFVYRELARPERLTFTSGFSDAAGGAARAPFSETWPPEVLNTVTLVEEDGRTVLTLSGGPIDPTPEERRTFEAAIPSMHQGFAGTWDGLAAYLAEPEAGPEAGSMRAEPVGEHRWLERMVGAWTYEIEAGIGSGEPAMRGTGVEHVRSLGGLWVVADAQGEMPGCGPGATLLTLGFDPGRGRFVGTFVGSMMNHLWLYDGALDEAGRLTLSSEGPSCLAAGETARYQDVIEFPADGERVMRSRVLGEDGAWREFMVARYRRTA